MILPLDTGAWWNDMDESGQVACLRRVCGGGDGTEAKSARVTAVRRDAKSSTSTSDRAACTAF